MKNSRVLVVAVMVVAMMLVMMVVVVMAVVTVMMHHFLVVTIVTRGWCGGGHGRGHNGTTGTGDHRQLLFIQVL
jgi:ABC-type transport system involved in Fe-S cluster assembly fused permease/ATPase subunit